MRALFIDRVIAEYQRRSGLGRALAVSIAEVILRRSVVESPDAEDVDPELLKYYGWTPKGLEAYQATRQLTYTLFGGAKGGGKTVTGARIIGSDVAEYRDGLFVICRRNYTTLHQTTKRSFDRFFPPELIISKAGHEWKCVNGNTILWWAADRTRDPDYEKTRGLEATGIFVDEASELDQEFYEILPTLLRRDAYHVETGATHPYWIYMTSNPVPGSNYLKRNFIDPRTRAAEDHVFIPSLPDENTMLPDGYVERAFSRMSDEMLAMLRYGDWNVEASEFAIVPMSHLAVALTEKVVDREPVAAGIDIGLGRPDKTVVVCANRAGEMWKELEFEEYDTTRQIDRLDPIIADIKGRGGRVWMDEGSVGKGVVDALRKSHGSRTVIGVMFGAAAEEERQPDGTMQRVHNLKRDQIYFWLREDVMLASELLGLSETSPLRIEHSEALVEELENTFYKPNDKYLKLEPKDEIKRRIGRSPDEADAAALCNAARRAGTITLSLPKATTKKGRRRRSMTDGY